jgi:hypothetical protein
VKNIAGNGVGIGKHTGVFLVVPGRQGQSEEALRFADMGGIDAPASSGPVLLLLALKPAPNREKPSCEKESEPDVKEPRPGAGIVPPKWNDKKRKT